MSGDKQIEEMAKIMNECCNRYDENGNHIGNKCYECEEWSRDNYCCCSYNTKEATALYEAGYRKESEVARDAIDVLCELHDHFKSVGDIREAFAMLFAIAELKKKYTEVGE